MTDTTTKWMNYRFGIERMTDCIEVTERLTIKADGWEMIRKAIELKHPARDPVDDEPERPRPSGKRGGIRENYAAGGYADAIDDREDTDSIGEDAEVDA